METVETIYKQDTLGVSFYKGYGEYLSVLLSRLDFEAISAVTTCLRQARDMGHTIFFAGNGGSAATASHFAQDIGEISRKVGGKSFRTFSLNDHAAALTATRND